MKPFQLQEEEVGFQMAPMIDIVFLLIIFFMIAANLSQTERIKLDIPEATKAKVAEDQSSRGTISIKDDGTFYIGATPATIDEIGDMVSARTQADPRFKVFLRASKQSSHKHAREVMIKCAESGCNTVIFSALQ